MKLYSGEYSSDVAYRVEGGNVYRGEYGSDVAYRISGNEIG